MKTPKILLACCLLVVPLFSSSQDAASVEWSVLSAEPRHDRWGAGVTSGGSYIRYWYTRKEITVHRYDANMILSQETTFTYEHDLGKGQQRWPTVMVFGSRLYVFSEFRKESSETTQYFVQWLDLNNMGDPSPVKLFRETPGVSYYDETLLRHPSPDGKYMLVMYSTPSPEPKNKWNTVHMEILDQDLEVVSQWEVDEYDVDPYSLDANHAKICWLSDNNPAFVVDGHFGLSAADRDAIRAQREQNKKAERTGPSKVSLVKLNRNGEKPSVYQLRLEPKWITSMGLTANENDQLILVGTYSEKYQRGTGGSFSILERPAKNDMGDLVMTPMAEEELDRYYLTHLDRKLPNKDELPDYSVEEVIHHNGATYLVSEFYNQYKVKREGDNGGVDYTYHYQYGSIAVTKFDAEGKAVWFTRVPKYQKSNNDGGRMSSFGHGFDGDTHYFLYRDHEKNAQGTYPKFVRPFMVEKNCVIVLAQIDADGKMSRKILDKTKDMNGQPWCKYSHPLGKNGFVVEVDAKNEWGYGKVTW